MITTLTVVSPGRRALKDLKCHLARIGAQNHDTLRVLVTLRDERYHVAVRGQDDPGDLMAADAPSLEEACAGIEKTLRTHVANWHYQYVP
jgi:hypothetical protein